MNVKQLFFRDIDHDKVYKVVKRALSRGNGGELFLEFRKCENLQITDSVIKINDFNSSSGFGLRCFSGEVVCFICSSEISEDEILKASSLIETFDFLDNNSVTSSSMNSQIKFDSFYSTLSPLENFSLQGKINILQEIDCYLRSKNQYIKQVSASLSGEWQVVHIMRYDGKEVSDMRPLVRLNVSVILEKNGRRESGSSGHGGRDSYETFISPLQWKKIADEALRQALINLESVSFPAGEMTVVLGSGWPGVLLHEAVGHGLEGDFNRKKVSAFSEAIGKRVAREEITVVDDGTIHGARGSINVDDEGNPSQYNTLIENGILKQYMYDNMNARLMNTRSTANGRRESYSDLVMPRMTNTYMLPGKYDPEDIIQSVKRGLYAVNFGGGQVDITSGKFVFSASESYWIENGKIMHPVKGATIIGNGPDVLTKVSMIGNDFNLDRGVGTCSKNGQNLPVGVGQPTLKIDNITVGGTEVS